MEKKCNAVLKELADIKKQLEIITEILMEEYYGIDEEEADPTVGRQGHSSAQVTVITGERGVAS